MSELKPCPFCGSPHASETATATGFSWSKSVYVCHSCGATGPRGENRDSARAAWNTRADSDGWVAMGDGLPENSGVYMATVDVSLKQDGSDLIENRRFYFGEGRWSGEEAILAWRRSAPYTPDREE